MFGNRINELAVPPQAARDRSAVEIARIWLVAGDQHVVLRPDVWEDPAAWGLLLVDLAKHAANTYHQSEGRDIQQTLNRIKGGFDAEWEHATDRPTGELQ
jgi:hypothetical protein